ncbi:hypothetical protein C2S52_000322 [Perilla frutescens var. hirtella]|nr:hypothetical protein C2S52_000322 [Perilla frutescens var. hirtella]
MKTEDTDGPCIYLLWKNAKEYYISLMIVNFDGTLTLKWKNSVQTSNSFGISMYKAPEHQPGAQVDQKVDVFSLGVILAELLHPFDTSAERIQILTRLKKDGPQATLTVPSPINERSLQPDLYNRPTMTKIMYQIEDVLVDE